MLPLSIELPPPERPNRGLLASARPLGGGMDWWRGVKFRSDGCAEPQIIGPCPDEVTHTPLRPGEATFWPVMIRQGAICSTLSGSDMKELAGNRLEWSREWSLGRELQTGFWSDRDAPPGGAGNPSLDDGTVVVAGTHDVVEALALLEQAGADNLHGAQLYIHGSPYVATHLLDRRVIWQDGRTWRTVTGSVFVTSPGYTGFDLYVTGQVFAATGRREVVADHDRDINDTIAWAGEVGIALFDPCWHGKAATDLNV